MSTSIDVLIWRFLVCPGMEGCQTVVYNIENCLVSEHQFSSPEISHVICRCIGKTWQFLQKPILNNNFLCPPNPYRSNVFQVITASSNAHPQEGVLVNLEMLQYFRHFNWIRFSICFQLEQNLVNRLKNTSNLVQGKVMGFMLNYPLQQRRTILYLNLVGECSIVNPCSVSKFVSYSTHLRTTICQQIRIFRHCKISIFVLHKICYLGISLVGWYHVLDTPLSANLWKQIL